RINSDRDLDSVIRDGCGTDFGGDRSRAVWWVIHQLIKAGKSSDEIVTVLLDRANRISDHVYAQARPEEYARRQVAKARESASDEIEIRRLAGLPRLEYERKRKEAAERLNIRASVLDKLVEAERSDNADPELKGRAISFPDHKPWGEPVDGAALLDSIA